MDCIGNECKFGVIFLLFENIKGFCEWFGSGFIEFKVLVEFFNGLYILWREFFCVEVVEKFVNFLCDDFIELNVKFWFCNVLFDRVDEDINC